jgi:hypothetical protein
VPTRITPIPSQPPEPPAGTPRPRSAGPAPAAADPPRPRASKVFTDREEPQEHFHRTRADLPADRHRIQVLYGVGGQGKTALRWAGPAPAAPIPFIWTWP